MVQPMKTEESTPIAARMSKADIMQFQERKAWYEECKKTQFAAQLKILTSQRKLNMKYG